MAGNASVVGDPAEAKPRAPPPPVLARPCKCPKETIRSRLHDMRAPRNRLAFGCARHAHSSEPDCLTTTATPTNPMRAPSFGLGGFGAPRRWPIRTTHDANPVADGAGPTHHTWISSHAHADMPPWSRRMCVASRTPRPASCHGAHPRIIYWAGKVAARDGAAQSLTWGPHPTVPHGTLAVNDGVMSFKIGNGLAFCLCPVAVVTKGHHVIGVKLLLRCRFLCLCGATKHRIFRLQYKKSKSWRYSSVSVTLRAKSCSSRQGKITHLPGHVSTTCPHLSGLQILPSGTCTCLLQTAEQ